jgi:hypothetical protein
MGAGNSRTQLASRCLWRNQRSVLKDDGCFKSLSNMAVDLLHISALIEAAKKRVYTEKGKLSISGLIR